jgi:hypothetical protein
LLTAMHVGAELIIPKFAWMNIAMGKMLTQQNISFLQVICFTIRDLKISLNSFMIYHFKRSLQR